MIPASSKLVSTQYTVIGAVLDTHVDQPRFSDDQRVGYRSPETAVVGVVPVVTDHIVVVFVDFGIECVDHFRAHLVDRCIEPFDIDRHHIDLFVVSIVLQQDIEDRFAFGCILNTRILLFVGVLYPEFAAQLFDLGCGVVCLDVRISLMEMDQQFFVSIEDLIAAHSDTALDIVYLVVFGIAEDDDILTLGTRSLYEVPVVVKVRQ